MYTKRKVCGTPIAELARLSICCVWQSTKLPALSWYPLYLPRARPPHIGYSDSFFLGWILDGVGQQNSVLVPVRYFVFVHFCRLFVLWFGWSPNVVMVSLLLILMYLLVSPVYVCGLNLFLS